MINIDGKEWSLKSWVKHMHYRAQSSLSTVVCLNLRRRISASVDESRSVLISYKKTNKSRQTDSPILILNVFSRYPLLSFLFDLLSSPFFHHLSDRACFIRLSAGNDTTRCLVFSLRCGGGSREVAASLFG